MLRIKVVNERERRQVTHSTGSVWLGRQRIEGHPSVLIDDPYVSRRQLRLEEVPPDQVVIENLGHAPLCSSGGRTILPGQIERLSLPLQLTVGQTAIEVHLLPPVGGGPSAARRPAGDQGRLAGSSAETPVLASLAELGASPSPDNLGLWFEALLSVHNSVAGSDAFYDETATAVVDLVGLDRGLVLLYRNGDWQVKADCAGRSDDGAEFSRSVLQQVVAHKRTFSDLPAAHLLAASLRNIEAVVASPILDQHGEVVGAVYGSRRASSRGGVIRPLEAQFVQLLASAVGASLTRLEQHRQLLQYEEELAIGRRIQSSFFPDSLPQPGGWQVAAYFSPAREVSGDFYDVFELGDGSRLAVAIADVCDKGVGAALFMALIRTLIRAFATSRAVAGVISATDEMAPVELANEYVLANHLDTHMFATLFFGVLDLASGELAYVNGGHEPPIILDSAGPKTRLTPTGPSIGLFSDARFLVQRIVLQAGDTLFAFTDGVTEARDAMGTFFGRERLSQLLGRSPGSATEGLASVSQALREHVGGAVQYDDATMVAVRRVP